MTAPEKHFLPARLHRLLTAGAAHAHYPLLVAALAFVATTTFSFPFAAVLIPAVLLAPSRWLWIGLLSGIASGCGAALLVEVFFSLGWDWAIGRYPELGQLPGWPWAVVWLQRYGLFAMLVIAASPMPQTPALLLLALSDPPRLGVALAVGIGKTIKYVFLAWATARYPARYARYR